MNERLVAIHDVLVVRQTDCGWHCEQRGRPLFIARGQVAVAVPIPSVGTRGTVQVREFAVRDLYPSGMPRGM